MYYEGYAAWQRHRKSSPATIHTYTLDLKTAETMLKKPLKDATESDIWRYATWLTDVRKLGSAARAKKMYALRSYYKYLRVKRIRTDDPTENLDIPRAQKRTPKYLTYDEMTRLKNTAQTPLKQAIIAMFYATGMRVSELVSLNKRQINWEAHRITIIGKGDKEREIPVSSTALTAVKRYLQTRNDNNPAVFVNSTGKCISKRTVQRYISEAGQAANIKRIPVSCHNLRHTYATHLLNKGIDINALKKWMGHSSINTTMIYAELLTETEDQLYTQSLPKGM